MIAQCSIQFESPQQMKQPIPACKCIPDTIQAWAVKWKQHSSHKCAGKWSYPTSENPTPHFDDHSQYHQHPTGPHWLDTHKYCVYKNGQWLGILQILSLVLIQSLSFTYKVRAREYSPFSRSADPITLKKLDTIQAKANLWFVLHPSNQMWSNIGANKLQLPRRFQQYHLNPLPPLLNVKGFTCTGTSSFAWSASNRILSCFGRVSLLFIVTGPLSWNSQPTVM